LLELVFSILSGFMANHGADLQQLTSWSSDWSQIKVAVVGVGKTGFSVADTLNELGSTLLVVAESALAETLDILEVLGVECVIDESPEVLQATVSSFSPDLLIVSPGVEPASLIVSEANSSGVPVWTDIDLAWRLKDRFGPGQEWICITGTNGKTTTTEITEAMLQEAGLRAVACGNIGTPILDCIRDPAEFEVLVVELSSFQLHYLDKIEPFSAAVLNVANDHLDWHGGFSQYRAAKGRMYENTKVACVYNLEDKTTEELVQAADVKEGARAIGFGLGSPARSSIGFVEDLLVDRAFLDERADKALEIANLEDLASFGVLTPHLLSNIAAATAMARSFGVSPDACRTALRKFKISAHRIELVGEVAGVRYINDSKATNAHAAQASLTSFESVVWILGGLLKGVDISDLIEQFSSRLRGAVIIGLDRAEIRNAFALLAPELPITEIEEGDQVMKRAVVAAASLAVSGDVVLLAPAAASMDQFLNYQERGDLFRKAVSELGGETL
jgi:UDP-N-acetylmuramoylalanine--D-glutamate ligase